MSETKPNYSMLGVGLYSLPAAAHYLHLPVSKVRRWAATVKGEEIPDLQEHQVISFLGLMELLAVKRLRGQQRSLGWIREAATGIRARHPLAHFAFHSADPSVEFAASDWPCRWWPLGREKGVRLDPAVSFGKPIVARGVPTYVLAMMVLKAGGDAGSGGGVVRRTVSSS